jgi:FKBP-type peptidyl-prolyl cis-trans isomerase FklB
MTRKFLLLGAAALIIGVGCARSSGLLGDMGLVTPEAQESYSLGSVLGTQIKEGVGDVDRDAFLAGLADALDDQSRLTPDEITLALATRREREIAATQQKAHEMAQRNQAEGEAYRAQFATDPGVVGLDSGLQYKVLAKGEGSVPEAGDVVTVHYRGSFVDGTEFDSSYARQEPASFPLEGVIPGWSEALQRMPSGSKWKLVVPPELAYGEQGAGGVIGPNATLIFEVELIDVG